MLSTSSDPLTLEGIAIKKGGRRRIILANLSLSPLEVKVKDLAENVLVRHLNETNIQAAKKNPEGFRAELGQRLSTFNGNLTLDLDSYAIARIDET